MIILWIFSTSNSNFSESDRIKLSGFWFSLVSIVCRKISQFVEAGFLNSVGGCESRSRSKRIHLWSDVSIRSVTFHSEINENSSDEDSVISRTSDLFLITKVGLHPVLLIVRFDERMNSKRLLPLLLMFVLPHA